MAGVDQLVVARRQVCQHPQPAERIHPLEVAPHTLGQRLPRRALEAVATRHEVALQSLDISVHDHRPLALDRLDERLPDDRNPALLQRVDQIPGHLRLTINGPGPGRGETRTADVLAGIDLAKAANANRKGRSRDRIDLTRTAIGGHSCGGL